MCLKTIIHNSKKESVDFCNKKLRKVVYRNQTWYVGWKACKVSSDNYIYLYYGKTKLNKISRSTTEWASNGLFSSFCEKYQAGFHIFKTRKDARNYSCKPKYKVLFQTPTCIGTQDGVVIIAKKMVILDKETAKCLKTK
jgi:hypothetical protein